MNEWFKTIFFIHMLNDLKNKRNRMIEIPPEKAKKNYLCSAKFK